LILTRRRRRAGLPARSRCGSGKNAWKRWSCSP